MNKTNVCQKKQQLDFLIIPLNNKNSIYTSPVFHLKILNFKLKLQKVQMQLPCTKKTVSFLMIIKKT